MDRNPLLSIMYAPFWSGLSSRLTGDAANDEVDQASPVEAHASEAHASPVHAEFGARHSHAVAHGANAGVE